MKDLTSSNSLIDSHVINYPARGRWNKAVKRALNMMLSLLGLIFLSPFLTLIAVFIKRNSPGPVFYRGRRLGKGDKPFLILKFRTMYECPES
jgi:lipopolysaccharide/colanic/teichoic acid biosynthesis glycosyltransferase